MFDKNLPKQVHIHTCVCHINIVIPWASLTSEQLFSLFPKNYHCCFRDKEPVSLGLLKPLIWNWDGNVLVYMDILGNYTVLRQLTNS